MATVFKGVEKVAAREARDAVRDKADELAVRSRQRLESHRHSGRSSIEVEHGKVDSFVVLDDPGPDGNALAIEFGRKGGEHGATQGVYALSYAIGQAPGG